jgi:outer membrane usher protein FimD/PapC
MRLRPTLIFTPYLTAVGAGMVALAMGMQATQAVAADTSASTFDDEIQLSVLTRLEVRTIQIDPNLPLRVQLEGEAFAGQVVRVEQRGMVIHEQQLREGVFRITTTPPFLDKGSPLTVRLQSPRQAEENTVLALEPNQRRELYAKRPELLALAPTARPVPLKDKLPLSKLEEDVEFDVDFLRGKAFRNLSPAEVKKLGSVRPGNVDTDVYRNGNLVTKGIVRFASKTKDDNLSPYYLNDVQVSLEGAPAELEVDNASQKVAPVEGSIVRLKFNATSGRPLLIVLQASNGVRIPIGATVTDSLGNEVGTVGQGSRALVRVQAPKDRLKVVWGDKLDETCIVEYALDAKQTANATGFTNLKLKCDVGGLGEKIVTSEK